MTVLPNTSLCSKTGILFRCSGPLSLGHFNLSDISSICLSSPASSFSILSHGIEFCYIYPLKGDPHNLRSYHHALHDVRTANLTGSFVNTRPTTSPQNLPQQVHMVRLLVFYLNSQKSIRLGFYKSMSTVGSTSIADNMTVKFK
jgi:hypothetical protein